MSDGIVGATGKSNANATTKVSGERNSPFQVQVVVAVVLVVAVRSLEKVNGRRRADKYCTQATPNPPKSR